MSLEKLRNPENIQYLISKLENLEPSLSHNSDWVKSLSELTESYYVAQAFRDVNICVRNISSSYLTTSVALGHIGLSLLNISILWATWVFITLGPKQFVGMTLLAVNPFFKTKIQKQTKDNFMYFNNLY